MNTMESHVVNRATRAGDDFAYAPEDLALLQAAYHAGVNTGRQEGYLLGYEAGRVEARRAAATKELEVRVDKEPERNNSGSQRRMLLGLPCSNCQCFFYSGETHCPVCGTPRVTTVALVSATHSG
jgi:hypothetical protein